MESTDHLLIASSISSRSVKIRTFLSPFVFDWLLLGCWSCCRSWVWLWAWSCRAKRFGRVSYAGSRSSYSLHSVSSTPFWLNVLFSCAAILFQSFFFLIPKRVPFIISIRGSLRESRLQASKWKDQSDLWRTVVGRVWTLHRLRPSFTA